MSRRKVVMVTEVTAVWGRMAEFNQRWEKHNLPYWQENGARYIGSYVSYLGADTNTTLRIFEFDDLPEYHRFMEARQAMFETDAGQDATATVHDYVEKIRETAWISIDADLDVAERSPSSLAD